MSTAAFSAPFSGAEDRRRAIIAQSGIQLTLMAVNTMRLMAIPTVFEMRWRTCRHRALANVSGFGRDQHRDQCGARARARHGNQRDTYGAIGVGAFDPRQVTFNLKLRF